MDRDPSYDRLVPSLDEWRHAHNAVMRAVARDGPQILSDPKRLAGFLDDELAGLPRERTLLVRAAEVQVPAIIKGMVSRSGTERAVELAAATLLALHGRDPDGCLWVAAELALVIGYRPAEYLSITEWIGPPGGYGDVVPGPAPASATNAAHPGAPGAPPADEAAASALFEPDLPRSNGYQDNTDSLPRSDGEPDRNAYLAQPSTLGPSTLVAPPGGEDEYRPRFKPRRRSRRLLRPKNIVGVLASLVLIYFAFAGIFLLPPYSKQNGSPPPATANQRALANERALLSHIPPAIRANCQASAGISNPEIVASATCEANSSTGNQIGIVYDQFGNSGAAKGAFNVDITSGLESWGPTAALANTQSCDPTVDSAFSGTGTYQRPPSSAVKTSDSGQIACWVSASRQPTIDWISTKQTIDANAVIMIGSGSGTPTQSQEQELYGFWEAQAGPQ